MGMNEYILKSQPLCSQAAVVQGDTYRITVLTPALLRLEYHPLGKFEDRATGCPKQRFSCTGFSGSEEKR